MKAICVLFCFVFATSVVFGQWANRVYLQDAEKFYFNVMQETISEVERRGFSTLKLNDISQTINQQMYKWHVRGNVTYTNGFLVSIQHMDVADVRQNTFSSAVSGVARDMAIMTGQLNFRDMKIGYDVIAELEEDGDHRFTGTFIHTTLRYVFTISKHLQTKETTVSGSVDLLSGGLQRMQYMPANNITEVISRTYTPSNIASSVSSWSREIFVPIILDVVQNKVPFPSVCLDCR